jgi:dCMP deaminase
MEKIILAYVPVLHQGYLQFFRNHAAETDMIFIFGQELINQFKPLTKDIRALSPEFVKSAIQSWSLFNYVKIADKNILETIHRLQFIVIMPDEDECHEVAEKYLQGCTIEFDNIFLRWDKTKSLAVEEVKYDRIVSVRGFESEIINLAEKESQKATNWWRQTGIVIIRDGHIILRGYNRQVPSAHVPYFEGDARSFFSRGINIELTTDQHAEAHVISEAARRGIALEDTDLYITTFPCPPCAKIVAYAGIKRCYFSSGYSMLDAERILHDKGVEIILVKMEE